MEISIKASLRMMLDLASAFFNGVTGQYIEDNLKAMKCMVMELSKILTKD